jgi:hypothetical protein
VPTILGSTPSGRRLRGLAVTGAALVALAGCSTGFNAQTSHVYDAGAGTNDRGSGVDLLNALFVENADGTATLSATLVLNPGEFDDGVEVPATVTLEDMTVTTLDGDPIEASLVEGGIPLEPNEPVKIGEEPVATVSGDNFAAGGMVTLNVDFDVAVEPIQMDVPVVTREGTDIYDEIAEASG